MAGAWQQGGRGGKRGGEAGRLHKYSPWPRGWQVCGSVPAETQHVNNHQDLIKTLLLITLPSL